MADGDLTFGVAIKSTGDGSVVTDAKAATTELENIKKATDELATSTTKMAGGYETNYAAMQQRLNALAVDQDNAKAKTWALANGYQEAGGVMVKASKEVADNVHVNSLAMRESLVLVREAARGNFSRMAGSASLLAQSLGAMPFLLNPIVLGVAAVGAAVAGGIYWWDKYGESLADVHAKLNSVADDGMQNLENKIALQNQTLSRMVSMNQKTGLSGLSDAEANRLGVLNLQIDIYTKRLAHAKQGTDEFTESTHGLAKAQESYNKLTAELADRQSLQQQKKDIGKTAKDPNAKLLAEAKRFDDQLLEFDKDSFTKRIDEWVKYEKTIEAQVKTGHAGALAEQKHHAAALEVLTTAEYNKRTAENKAKEKAADQHRTAAFNSEKKFFAEIRAMADAASTSALGREQLRYDRELIALDSMHAKTAKAVQADHAKALAEEAAYQQAKLDLETGHENRRSAMKDDSDRKIVNGEIRWKQISLESSEAFFGTAKGLMNSHSHAMFEIGKAAAISEAVIHTYSSATKAFDAMAGIPYVGPELGALAAAAAIASGLAQISAIQSTSFGGGASGGGSYGGANSSTNGGNATPNYPVSPAAPTSNQNTQPPAQTTIYLMGNVLTPDFVDQYVLPNVPEYLKNSISNNDFVIIDPRSRQAQMLAAT